MKTLAITEVKARLLALIDEVESGEEIAITRHGRTVARIVPEIGGPESLKGRFAGRAWTTDPDDDLLSTGLEWEVERDTSS